MKANKNFKLLIILCFIAVLMLGVGFAFVPLYRVFCQTFGIPVPTIVVGESNTERGKFAAVAGGLDGNGRIITVRFIANQAQGMPVVLRPTERKVDVAVGVPYLTAYKAMNATYMGYDGVAVHMLSALGSDFGQDATDYIELQQCFCFEEQHYPAQTEVNLPLSFTITPNIPDDVHTLTFAYTLFEDKD